MPDSDAILNSFRHAQRRRQEFYWLRRNKFYATTPFGGFVLIHTAKSKIEAIGWYLVLAIFFVFTVVQVSFLTDQYLNQPSFATVSISENINKTTVPNFTFCLNNKWMLLESSVMKTRHFQEDTSYLERSVQASLDKLTTKQEFQNSSWSIDILAAVQKYLSAIFDREKVLIRSVVLEEQPFLYPLTHELLFSSPNHLLVKHLHKIQVFTDELVQEFSKQVTALMVLRVTGLQDSSFVPLDFALTSILRKNTEVTQVCFHLKESRPMEMVRVSALLHKMDNAVKKAKLSDNRLITDLSWASMDLDPLSKHFGLKRRHDGYQIERNQAFSVNLSVSAVIHSVQNCSQEMERTNCFLQCVSKRLKENCGCNAIFNSPRADTCSLEDHFICMENTKYSVLGDKPLCSHCIQPCKQVITRTDDTGYKNVISEPEFMTAEIRMMQNRYPSFTEHYSQTTTAFLGCIGGLLSLWIGATVTGMLHLLVYLCKQLAYTFNSKTKTARHIRWMARAKHDNEPLGNGLVNGLELDHNEEQWDDQLAITVGQHDKNLTRLTHRVLALEKNYAKAVFLNN